MLCDKKLEASLTLSNTPSSKANWSGLSRESVGATFSLKPGVNSFKHMANLVMLYLQVALFFLFGVGFPFYLFWGEPFFKDQKKAFPYVLFSSMGPSL